MNTPPPNVVPLTETVTLPDPGYPMLTRVLSNPLFPPDREALKKEPSLKDEPIAWIVGSQHPLVPSMKIVRMFVDRGGVEIYSVSPDGRSGTRNMIPMSQIRIIEEAMPLDVFIEELDAAENDDDDDPDDPEVEPETAPEPEPEVTPAPVPNGQTAPS